MFSFVKRSQNIKNSFWGILNITLYPAAFLAATPFFLDALGESLFGVWMVINSVIFISVHLVHFGLGNALTMFVAEARGKGFGTQINRFFNASFNFTGLAALFVFAAALLVWLFFGHLPFPDVPNGQESDVRAALSIAFCLIGVKFFEQLYQGFFKGFEKYDTAALFNIGNRMATLTAQVYCAHKGYGLTGIISASLVLNGFFVAWQHASALKQLHLYKWAPKVNAVIWKKLGGFGFWTWLQTIISLLSFQLDRFIVAYFLGTEVVAYYSIASMIANHLHVALEATVAWLFPKISRYRQEGRDTKALYSTMRGFLLTISLCGLLGLFAVREPLFTLWLGEEKYEKMIGFIELFIYLEVFYVLSIAPKFFLNGMARMKLITSLEFFYKLLGIVFMCLSFFVSGTASSLIWGQIVALMVSMPIEAYVVNKRVLNKAWLEESLLITLPCFCSFAAMYTEVWYISILFLALTAIFVKAIYLKKAAFEKALLLE